MKVLKDIASNGNKNFGEVVELQSDGSIKVDGTITTNGVLVAKQTDITPINSGLTNVASTVLNVTTTNNEVVLLETTIATAGVYLFLADLPINYYGGVGRDLYVRLKINNVIVLQNDGVINSYAYTLNRHLMKMYNVPANANIKVTIQSGNSQQFSCLGFDLQYIRLK